MADFIVKTRDGLHIGPFSRYEIADSWAKRSIFEIEDVYKIIEPREDHLKANGDRAVVPLFKSRRTGVATGFRRAGEVLEALRLRREQAK